MQIYYFMIVITYFLALIVRIIKDNYNKYISYIFLILLISIIVIISGLRSRGGDTYFYIHTYKGLVDGSISAEFDKDALFTLLNLILIQISTNPQILIFTTSLITHTCNLFILNKYNSLFELEVFMYITSGYYFTTTNGIRQSLAAALIFMCIKYLINKNLLKYTLFILLISMLHASVLIMIPVYFIVHQKEWSKKIAFLLILSVISLLAYNLLEGVLFSLLKNTQYGHYSEFQEGGSSFIRTIINAVPVVLAFIKRDILSQKLKNSNIFVNFSIINLIFVAFGMANWIFNRFSIYFQLYNMILLPFIIRDCFPKRERRIIYFLFIVGYFIFFFREQVIGFSEAYHSNYLNIENFFYKSSIQ